MIIWSNFTEEFFTVTNEKIRFSYPPIKCTHLNHLSSGVFPVNKCIIISLLVSSIMKTLFTKDLLINIHNILNNC